jgi:energy-coupling factor transporter ATP-binding protein EcfA2
MITRFHVCNYKALRDVTLELTPMHMLIGPNDSGKTSILEALAAICRSVRYPLKDIFRGKWEGAELVWKKDASQPLRFAIEFVTLEGIEAEYELALRFESDSVRLFEERIDLADGTFSIPKIYENAESSYVKRSACDRMRVDNLDVYLVRVHNAIDGVHLHRFDPRLIGLPVGLPAKSQRHAEYSLDYSGFGLALCLDDLLSYDRESFIALEKDFKRLFPHVRSIKLMRGQGYQSASSYSSEATNLRQIGGKGIYFEFDDGYTLPARQASDGMLIVLAYLAILYMPMESRPGMLLIEEPENGVHPSRLKEIIGIVRELVDARRGTTQVVMTTHSPYVLDEFRPEEVTVCLRQPDGSIKTQRLSESAVVQQQLDVFSLGEIWTAEGDEALAKEADPQHAEKAD